MATDSNTNDRVGQSYLSGISRLSPWTRSPVIPPASGANDEPSTKDSALHHQRGGDHRLTHKHRLSLRNYPKDCPRLSVQWFHAVDVPKRRPNPAGASKAPEKPTGPPKKYSAFAKTDSKALEAAYRSIVEEEDVVERSKLDDLQGDVGTAFSTDRAKPSVARPNQKVEEADAKPSKIKIPVNEDYLFDVDVEKRELGPTYWLGPVYDVRRGTWFYQDGSVQKPCDENLAAQLEEGYLKVKAWKLPSTETRRAASQPRARPLSWAPGRAESKPPISTLITPKPSDGDLRESRRKASEAPVLTASDDAAYSTTHRLFGSHMNSVVTYQDATTAWILTDDLMSRMSSTMYQRFAGGGHFAGMKVARGYTTATKKPEFKDEKVDVTNEEAKAKNGIVNTSMDADELVDNVERQSSESGMTPVSENRRRTLERHMSSLLDDPSAGDPERQAEEVRKRDEKEIEDDYREAEGDEQGREIEHLILVTHGIGQRLGLRMESVNFVHDVNTLRKTLKAVYAESADLQALNAELESSHTKNSRVQVLPICWRHLLDFPKQSLKHSRREHDLGDSGFGEEEDYPNLDDIAVEGVPAVRNLITDLALDILLYQSPAYKDHISRIVLEECNRIYHLFMDRNADFKGKVSMIGHSLGSAIMFDILCKQQDQKLLTRQKTHQRRGDHHLRLDFEVENFYALGSPIGLFQMLKGRTIAGRQINDHGIRGRNSSATGEEQFLDSSSMTSKANAAMGTTASTSEIPNSSPACKQLYNIFHPTDPIAYRLEPLISLAMKSLKPQPLPYTKRGIFGAPVGQGLTGIGARVGQSVSGLFSSISSGIAANILTRGLGYNVAEQAKQITNTAQNPGKSSAPLSMGAGTIPIAPLPAEGTTFSTISGRTDSIPEDEQHPPTLIDAELETLCGGYQQRRKSVQDPDSSARDLGESEEWAEAEERRKRLRREEEKVRRLNSNGRIDYAIQEGAFDLNFIASIASHLSYWQDEDVSHFMISQLLSRNRVIRHDGIGGGSTQKRG